MIKPLTGPYIGREVETVFLARKINELVVWANAIDDFLKEEVIPLLDARQEQDGTKTS